MRLDRTEYSDPKSIMEQIIYKVFIKHIDQKTLLIQLQKKDEILFFKKKNFNKKVLEELKNSNKSEEPAPNSSESSSKCDPKSQVQSESDEEDQDELNVFT